MRDFQQPGRSPAIAGNGMAATSSPQATLAALDVLRAGGNAVDAAVTAAAVLCVTEPHMTGIGGDCFALVAEPSGKVLGLNGSGRASLRADADWLKAAGLPQIPLRGIHAITVPGAVDAWDRLLRRCGTIGLGEALEPAIRLAEAGVPTLPRVAHDWAAEAELLSRDPGGRRHYLKGARAPLAGEVMRYPALAATFRRLAAGGRDEFYEGSIARDIIATIAPMGSLLGRDDFARTAADWVEPIATRFAGHDIVEIPPSGQGLTALMALNILSVWGLRRHDPESPERAHLEIEAMKIAWVFRNRHIADPDFSDMPVEELLSAATARRLASLIDMGRALDVRLKLPQSDTVYISIVDRSRMAVSFINSIYDAFGTGIVTEATGIALQNRGACFLTDPRHPNCIGPGKRPLHTIIPAMAMKDGAADMSFGVMGGSYQPMGHVTVAVNRYVYGMDPQEALDFPRHFPADGAVRLERGVARAVRQGLAARGHAVAESPKPLGGGQAIAIDRREGVLLAGSDPRKDGLALGY